MWSDSTRTGSTALIAVTRQFCKQVSFFLRHSVILVISQNNMTLEKTPFWAGWCVGAAQEATAYLDRMTALLRGEIRSVCPRDPSLCFPNTSCVCYSDWDSAGARLSPTPPPPPPSLLCFQPPSTRHHMRKRKRKKHGPKSTLFTLSQEGSPIRVLHSGHHRTWLSVVCSFVSISFNKMLSAAFCSYMCAFQIKLLISEHYIRLKSNEN